MRNDRTKNSGPSTSEGAQWPRVQWGGLLAIKSCAPRPCSASSERCNLAARGVVHESRCSGAPNRLLKAKCPFKNRPFFGDELHLAARGSIGALSQYVASNCMQR